MAKKHKGVDIVREVIGVSRWNLFPRSHTVRVRLQGGELHTIVLSEARARELVEALTNGGPQ